MKITFSPIHAHGSLSLGRVGDIVMIDDRAFDFSALPDGHCMPREAVGCDMLASDVRRVGGQVELTLLLPYTAPDPAITHPAAIVITADGPVSAPGLSSPVEVAGPGDIDWSQMVDEAAALVPQEVSRFQARAALMLAGHMPAVAAAIAAADPLAQLAWSDAQVFRRDSPTIAALATAIGMTAAQIDALFIQAAQIEA